MISTTKANEILNNLFGIAQLSRPIDVYLGLAAKSPDADGTINEEQTRDTTGNASGYVRKRVGGSGTTTENLFNVSADGGKISNGLEIKFNTARAKYDKVMTHWFLSTSNYGGSAFLWGRLKDVLFEKGTKLFGTSDIENTYAFETQVDDLMNMKADTDYVVWWRNPADTKDAGKEYDVKSTEYVKNGTTYIHLGNPVVKGGIDDGTPFAVLYKQVTNGADTTGTIRIYSTVAGAQFEVAVYGLGIEVKKATVPTFYKGELTASIKVQTDED